MTQRVSRSPQAHGQALGWGSSLSLGREPPETRPDVCTSGQLPSLQCSGARHCSLRRELQYSQVHRSEGGRGEWVSCRDRACSEHSGCGD